MFFRDGFFFGPSNWPYPEEEEDDNLVTLKRRFAGYFAWLLWSIFHLLSMSGCRNRLMVGFNWAVSYFSYEKSNRPVIRNFKPKSVNQTNSLK